MKTRNFVIAIGSIAILIIALLTQVRGLESVFIDIVDLIKGLLLTILLLLVVFIGPLLIGILANSFLVKIDKNVDKTVVLTGKQKLWISLLVAIFVGVIWLLLVPLLVSTDWSELRQLWKDLGHWSGAYESSPMLWGLYALAMAWGGFWIYEVMKI